MSAPLSDAEERQYTSIIDAILATADLATVSRKKVRQGLEQALGGKDLGEQKVAIKSLIEARFDAISTESQGSGAIPTPPSAPLPLPLPTSEYDRSSPIYKTNGHKPTVKYEDEEEEDDDDDDENANGEIRVSIEPAPKKVKRTDSSLSVEDADARLAAQLQDQENRLARGRTTRGGGSAAKPKKKKKAAGAAAAPRKKSAARVKGEDDESGPENSGDETGGKRKRKAGGGFQKPFNLSYALADLCGEAQLPRPQVVKRLWQHIKANDLQDPSNKRQIICDDKMQAVFKQSRVDMFTMNKLLGNELYPVDE